MEHSWFDTDFLQRKNHLHQRRPETTKVMVSKHPMVWLFDFDDSRISVDRVFLYFFFVFLFALHEMQPRKNANSGIRVRLAW